LSTGRRLQRRLILTCALIAALVAGLSGTALAKSKPRTTLDWAPCGESAPTFECATAQVPLDYSEQSGTQIKLAVTRLPARDQEQRVGSLFVNYGGPGAGAVEITQATGDSLWANLNERFDIVAFDPRGTGLNEPAIDCKANQKTEGVYGVPFVTPENLDPQALIARDQGYVDKCLRNNDWDVLRYATTANVARDMDRLRAAVGDEQLSYLGFSYGTFLGATYESLYPERYRALVLDGALDADEYINQPMDNLLAQSAGFERAIGRFFQACAADQAACLGFGGSDPWDAFDSLADQADANPIPASTGEPVTGDDLRNFMVTDVYNKVFWAEIAQGLVEAAAGDASLVRLIVDNVIYGEQPDGSFDPGLDRYFTLSALEQRYSDDPDVYFAQGRRSYNLFDHVWFNAGYVELNWGLFPVKPKGAFRGPFVANPDATPTLVVGTTYDPATPYRGSKALARQLGNARLLTMRGDGHTAYGGNSPCIDAAVEAYLLELTVPAAGTSCRQDVPFAQPEPKSKAMKAGATVRRTLHGIRIVSQR
jgi:pimeloyl-ACP methyl ester carboxylesterase